MINSEKFTLELQSNLPP